MLSQDAGSRALVPFGERDTLAVDAETAVRNAHRWFEHNSGWAPPDDDTLAEWMADGVCRCPDECLVAPEGWCEHGLASWTLILAALVQEDAHPLAMGLERPLDD